MAIVGTKFIWDDQSDITALAAPAEDTVDRPVFMCVFSSDKGPEEFQKLLMGKKFFDLYGTVPSFTKHGQTLLQAANIINAGGRLFCKRVVAEDSTLANIGICVKVTKVQVQKTDSNGNPIYTDGTTETTIATGNTPVMIQKVKLTYSAKMVNIKGNSVSSMANSFLAANKHTNAVGSDGEYPLFLLMDNGRGKSYKKFRMYTDNNASKPVDYTKYVIKILENNDELESFSFAFNPDIVESKTNLSLQNVIATRSNQLRCKIFEDEIKSFMENVAYLTSIDNYKNSDIFFGTDFYGVSYDNIIIDSTGLALDAAAGINLINPDDGRDNGGNGEFGLSPVDSETYYSEIEKVFNGSFGDEIYDVDNSRIDVIFDANFPASVKRSIESLASFREDCVFFRDIGLNRESIEEIELATKEYPFSRFYATYTNSWDVIDPYTYKQIPTTMTYSLATKFVKHYLNGISRPIAGQLYGMVFDDAINGTVNFIPKNTPAVDQREFFDTNRLNYCKYYDGSLVLETEYTANEKYTQFSFLHNVLTVQELIREIRTKCPKNRYRFMDGNDMVRYKDDINAIIKNHSSEYKSIYMDYVQDSTYESNKIFYAVIYVTFRNFVQSEIFKITALKS